MPCHSSSQFKRYDESRSKSFKSFITHQPQFKTLNQNESHEIKCRDVLSSSSLLLSPRALLRERFPYHFVRGFDILYQSQCIRENWHDKERMEKINVDREKLRPQSHSVRRPPPPIYKASSQIFHYYFSWIYRQT